MTDWDAMVLHLRYATDRLIAARSESAIATDKADLLRLAALKLQLDDQVAFFLRWLSEHNRLPEVDTL